MRKRSLLPWCAVPPPVEVRGRRCVGGGLEVRGRRCAGGGAWEEVRGRCVERCVGRRCVGRCAGGGAWRCGGAWQEVEAAATATLFLVVAGRWKNADLGDMIGRCRTVEKRGSGRHDEKNKNLMSMGGLVEVRGRRLNLRWRAGFF